MKTEQEIIEILIEEGNYTLEDAEELIAPVPRGNYDAIRGHILSQTGIDIDKY